MLQFCFFVDRYTPKLTKMNYAKHGSNFIFTGKVS